MSYVERCPVQKLDWYDGTSRLTTQSSLCVTSAQIAHILHRHSLCQNAVTTTLGIGNTGLHIRAALQVSMNMPVSYTLTASNARVLKTRNTSLSLIATSQMYFLCPQITTASYVQLYLNPALQNTILHYLRCPAPFLKCII